MLLFSSLLEFHNDIMFFLCQIILLVFFILFYTFFYITRFNSFSFLSAYSVLYVFIFFVILAFYSFFLSNLFVNSLESSFFFFNFNLVSVIAFLFILYFSFILAVFFGNYFFNSDSAFEPIFLLSFETFLLNFFFSFSNQNLGFENDTTISKKTFVYQTKKPVVFELVLETLWTIFPSLILLVISISSFTILYGLDDQTVMNDASYDNFYLKTIGRQWYWSYEVESTNGVNSENGSNSLYYFGDDIAALKHSFNENQVLLSGVSSSHNLFIATVNDLVVNGNSSGSINEVQSTLNTYLSAAQENLKLALSGVSALDSDNVLASSVESTTAALATSFDLISAYDLLINQLFNISTSISKLTQSGNTSGIVSTAFDSYMMTNDDFLIVVGSSSDSIYFESINRFRLLETDTVVQIPLYTLVRLFVTSTDVLHSWTVPAFGLKIDACPGRLNQGWLFLDREGVFYGQCSELCGLNHGFMPIVISVNSL